MYEVEVKVRADHEPVRAALQERDARRIGTVAQSDVYYDAPHRNFAETDEALRIRDEVAPDDGETVLTYKGPLVEENSKTREEIETRSSPGTSSRPSSTPWDTNRPRPSRKHASGGTSMGTSCRSIG